MESTPLINNTSRESELSASAIAYIGLAVLLGIAILVICYVECCDTPKPYHSPSTVSPRKNDRESHGRADQSRRLLLSEIEILKSRFLSYAFIRQLN